MRSSTFHSLGRWILMLWLSGVPIAAAQRAPSAPAQEPVASPPQPSAASDEKIELCQKQFRSAVLLTKSYKEYEAAIRIFRDFYRNSDCFHGIDNTANALIGISKSSYYQGKFMQAMIYYYWYLDILTRRNVNFPSELIEYRRRIDSDIRHILRVSPSKALEKAARKLYEYETITKDPADLLRLSQYFCENLYDAELSLALREYHADLTRDFRGAEPIDAPRCPAPLPMYRRWWFWTLIGLGVAGSATAIGLAIHSTSPSIPAPYADAPIIVF